MAPVPVEALVEQSARAIELVTGPLCVGTAARLALFLEASRDERLRSASEGIILHRIARHDERDPRPLLEAVVRGALAAPATHPAALSAAPEQST